ncbi:MAG TPA: thioredoxin family protein [Chlorobaculum sp.]|jgi:small redox-active disulfide protein 2|uniref:Glutaredoxin family protein n=1 Tax=Chlorobaculum tepidum (strain ATCC 49652 / DSM 12025 / NBRC 103806 / TLS) TaxID=194439 RepID=Q8KBQ7_CHLTE|nr:thioredoxin family protein [Chlorobaculum tepidum]AAM72950.1 glutaredoxin family protein [Chlorobaculum tepidum TLS]HBU22577.1 thioredoxin family protein [Chlorobaculum sp.]
MKKIKILGTGCAKCNQLTDAVKAVIAAENIEAEVQKVEDMQQIVSYGVMSTPGLVVDGKVVCSGRIPSGDELREMLTAAPKPSCCCGDYANGTDRPNGTC